MIPKITPKFQTKLNSTQRKIPVKEVIITSKKGRDRISDVYIGGFPRTSFIDVIRDLFENFFMNPPRH